jgi:[acyl-carrier-protein] S-malonyltransferase
MAGAWAQQSPAARLALAEAADVLGFDLPGLITHGPEDELNDTVNQQPAILAASVAILRANAESLPAPAYVAGHSLGEYSALVAAGALGYPAALRLVRERGRLMRLAGEQRPGRMAAILGLEDAAVEQACAELVGVQVANTNAPGQVVISGEATAVAQAGERLLRQGAKKVVTLPITIAAHSALMAPVAEEFAAAVRAVALVDAHPPLVANLSARPISRVDELRAELVGQLTGPVRWTACLQAMHAAGVTTYLEVGPGKVLSGLVKRCLAADRSRLTILSLGEPQAAPAPFR